MINGSGSALELLADSSELADELSAVADFLISLIYFLESGEKLVRQVLSAVFAVSAVGCREFFKIIIKISIFIHVKTPFADIFSILLYRIMSKFAIEKKLPLFLQSFGLVGTISANFTILLIKKL